MPCKEYLDGIRAAIRHLENDPDATQFMGAVGRLQEFLCVEELPAEWHIEIDSWDYENDAPGPGNIACGPKTGVTLVADYPFQVTCKMCQEICKARIILGNPDRWPTGADEVRLIERYEEERRRERYNRYHDYGV